MLHFLSDVKQSMTSSRRSRPIPQDFVSALAHNDIKSSLLLPHTKVRIPPLHAQPPIQRPLPAEAPPVNLDGVLGNELSGLAEKSRRRYVPKTFPSLPSKHTWQSTPVFAARETDPRRIRERATEEGVQAEQALRKLMAAKKSGLQKQRPLEAKKQNPIEVRRRKAWEDALQAVTKVDEEDKRRFEEERGWVGNIEAPAERDAGGGDAKEDIGMLVNYERKYWRKSAQDKTAAV
jgi:transcription initiation factor TFIID subunit 8